MSRTAREEHQLYLNDVARRAEDKLAASLATEPTTCFIWHPTAAAICTLAYGHPKTIDHESAFGHVWPAREGERRMKDVPSDAIQIHDLYDAAGNDHTVRLEDSEFTRLAHVCENCGQPMPEAGAR